MYMDYSTLGYTFGGGELIRRFFTNFREILCWEVGQIRKYWFGVSSRGGRWHKTIQMSYGGIPRGVQLEV